MKCRDKLGLPMAGPKLPLMGYCAYYLRQADYKRRRALKPCHIGVSSHPFDVASYRSDGSRMAYKPRAIAFFIVYNYIENNAKPYSTDH